MRPWRASAGLRRMLRLAAVCLSVARSNGWTVESRGRTSTLTQLSPTSLVGPFERQRHIAPNLRRMLRSKPSIRQSSPSSSLLLPSSLHVMQLRQCDGEQGSCDSQVVQQAVRPRGPPDSGSHQLRSADSRRSFFRCAAAAVASAATVGTEQSNAIDLQTFIPGGNVQKLGGLANKIRGILRSMDELQRDLMQERWDLVQAYPAQLRSYVPVFTTYTDAAFPSDLPSDYGLRVALRYEVGRYFASLERLKRAVARKSLDEAYIAYSDMSLHLDRYLRVGGLYTYYDSVIDNEPLFKEYKDALVHSDPLKDPAEVRDLVVLIRGPDTGRTGIVIGIYPEETNNCVVKLDKQRGMREIRVVPQAWAAKRLGEQNPDDVFLIPRKPSSNGNGSSPSVAGGGSGTASSNNSASGTDSSSSST